MATMEYPSAGDYFNNHITINASLFLEPNAYLLLKIGLPLP